MRLGESDAASDPDCVESTCAPGVVDVAVEEKVVHEDYQRGVNDIALLRLARPVVFSGKVRGARYASHKAKGVMVMVMPPSEPCALRPRPAHSSFAAPRCWPVCACRRVPVFTVRPMLQGP